MTEHNPIERENTLTAIIDGTPRTLDLNAGRRAFLRGVGAATVGAGILGTIGGGVSPAAAQSGGDVAILNFALNLEYLEAEFYLQAAIGRGLADEDTTGTGQRGNVQGGRRVNFESDDIAEYAREIAEDEEKHVKFLRAALGGAAVARPAIDISSAFTAAARAAGLVGNNAEFDAYQNETNFLLAAYIFEDVGVTAYKGAAPLIENPAVLSAAAGLLGTEAYHAGLVRGILYARGLIAPARAISNLRDSVDGRSNRDQGIGGRGNQSNIVPTDRDALVFGRTAEQVLAVVYLGGEGEGGFYPNGINT